MDIHKNEFNAAIVRGKSLVAEMWFPNDINGAQALLRLLREHGCSEIALESTGPYWMGLYDYLTQHGATVLVSNPASLKAIVGKKTDRVDAQILGYLHMAGLVNPSYVPDKRYRELRNLCRTREKLVSMRTKVKNATTSQINTFSSEITSVFSDTFGRSGMRVLKAILKQLEQNKEQEDKDEDDDDCDHDHDCAFGRGCGGGEGLLPVLEKLRKAGLKEAKIEKVGSALRKAYTPSINAGMVEFFLRLVEHLDKTVEEMDDTLARLVCEDHEIGRHVMLLVSIKGISLVTAVSMVAEIGDVSRFPSDKKMCSYMGLVPSVHQSGSKHITGRITKRGSPHARRAYYQAAQSLIRSKQDGPPVLLEFYNRIRAKKGHKVAAVALARKLVSVTYFMLTRRQDYNTYLDSEKKRKDTKIRQIHSRARRARNRESSLAHVLNLAEKMELVEVIPQELKTTCE